MAPRALPRSASASASESVGGREKGEIPRLPRAILAREDLGEIGRERHVDDAVEKEEREDAGDRERMLADVGPRQPAVGSLVLHHLVHRERERRRGEEAHEPLLCPLLIDVGCEDGVARDHGDEHRDGAHDAGKLGPVEDAGDEDPHAHQGDAGEREEAPDQRHARAPDHAARGEDERHPRRDHQELGQGREEGGQRQRGAVDPHDLHGLQRLGLLLLHERLDQPRHWVERPHDEDEAEEGAHAAVELVAADLRDGEED
mmetsp:Transcript_7772/g.19035  ORF Transcript_7772/g.19035 Transcript_7772/m.19035 type:complete len:259 (+) Transcript_7772:2413-3189(+)